jgi:hypothetical protein
MRSFTGTNQAANTEISETVPAGKAWLLISVSVALVQGITQTPQPILILKDPSGNVVYENFGSTTAQAVSTTCRYNWIAGGPAPAGLVGATTNVHTVSCLPSDCYLPEGSTITTNTIGIGANSDYGAPQILVIEFS